MPISESHPYHRKSSQKVISITESHRRKSLQKVLSITESPARCRKSSQKVLPIAESTDHHRKSWPPEKVQITAGSYRWQLYASHNDIVENIDCRRKSALKFLLQDIVLLDALVYLRVCESQTRCVKLKTRVRKSQAITESGCGSLKMSWLLDAEISKCNDFWVCKSQM